MAVGDGVVEGLRQGLADAERLDRRVGVVQGIAVGAVGSDGDRAIGAGLAAGGGDRQHIAGIDIGVVGQHIAGDRRDGVFGDGRRIGLATGPSLVPVMVMVSVEVDVPPWPSEIV